MRSGRKRWEARTQACRFSPNNVWHAPPNLPAILAKAETASATIFADLWRQLKPGSLVLAAGFDEQYNLAGWWEAIIVRIDDGEFLVRWLIGVARPAFIIVEGNALTSGGGDKIKPLLVGVGVE